MLTLYLAMYALEATRNILVFLLHIEAFVIRVFAPQGTKGSKNPVSVRLNCTERKYKLPKHVTSIHCFYLMSTLRVNFFQAT